MGISALDISKTPSFLKTEFTPQYTSVKKTSHPFSSVEENAIDKNLMTSKSTWSSNKPHPPSRDHILHFSFAVIRVKGERASFALCYLLLDPAGKSVLESVHRGGIINSFVRILQIFN
ncbi:hypothetical protein TNCT_637201 [Trichonephila clavata]|uniref:Uncharacterized protein n=1 Tax=Trichonephila clavata TaxID=2740835 RepID=A0A8X6JTE9_TRICU|nr:hypothetical protein TNCT_637201 [Trichonephila clavata]